jgi:predicted nucleic acid-binding protein
MASNRLGFNQFLKKVTGQKNLNLIVDSNILIANFDEEHTNHKVVNGFLVNLDDCAEVHYHTTVTTKAEFLDYQRRRFLTDGIFSLSSLEDVELKASSKQIIYQMKMRRGKRVSDEAKRIGLDEDSFDSSINYLRDTELKEIKKAFRARDVQKEIGWLKLCELFLVDNIEKQEALVDEFCTYLSAHNDKQAHLFNNREIDWKKATSLSSTTGMGYSDALILNMFSETRMDYILTLDYDLIYGVSICAKDKFVVLPDNRLGDFKSSLKKM